MSVNFFCLSFHERGMKSTIANSVEATKWLSSAATLSRSFGAAFWCFGGLFDRGALTRAWSVSVLP